MDYPPQRRQALARRLADEGLDALLVTQPHNVSYLTGFSGDSSYLIVGRERSLLISDFRFIEQLAEECPGLETLIRPAAQPVQNAAAQALIKLSLKNVGFESMALTVGDLESLRQDAPTLEWKGGKDRVEQLRMVKDDSEIAAIREAIAIAEKAFTMFRSMLRPSDNEKELSDAMESYIRRAGGTASSFPCIVGVNERAALPHAPPTARTLVGAELLLVDWGACGRFYKSDLTRVLSPRKIPPQLAKVHAVVLRAQQRAIDAVRPGATGQAIDTEARSLIAQEGFGKYFDHGLGHGIGLQVHEGPSIRQNSTAVLQPGMVFTIEPGIYLPGWGGVRIEDDVLVTPDGCEVLTSVPRGLDELTL